MKKCNLIFGILIGLLIFNTSCSSEDKEPSISELLIGTWKQAKIVSVCSNERDFVHEYNDCINKSTIVFTTEGKLNRTNYDYACGQSNARSGTWKIIDEKLIITTIEGTGEPEFFQITNNTLRLGYYHTNKPPCGNGQDYITHQYTEYTRVK